MKKLIYLYAAILFLGYIKIDECAAQWEPDVRLTNSIGFSTTTDNNGWSIAADGNAVYVAWRDDRDGNSEIYFKRSTNGGLTWGVDTRLTENTATSSFPTIAVFGQNVHIAWRDYRDGALDEIYYKRSTNGGLTWGVDTRLTYDSSSSSYPSLAVNGTNVHVVWHDNRDGNNEIYYKRSTNNGATWGTDIRLTNNSATSKLATIAVSDSIVHVAWEDYRDGSGNPEIYYKRSTDRGITWEADKRLTNNGEVSWSPCIAVWNSFVHIVWEDYRDGNLEIYYKRSADNGINWGVDTRLSNNSAYSNTPSIAISGSNIHVVWGDERDGNKEIYYKNSKNMGLTWGADTRLTNNSGISQYPTVAVSNMVVHVVWFDDRDGDNEIYYKRNPNTCPITWETLLKITDNGNVSDTLYWGTSINGTNGIDNCLGEYELPPAPPTGEFDSRFELPVSPAVETGLDIRSDTANALTWRIKFQPSASGYPITFRWINTELPNGAFRLKDEITGSIVNVNMKTQNTYTLTNTGITSLKIEYLDIIEVNMSFIQGWNLLSIPVLTSDMSISALFPGGPTQAFKYVSSYVPVTTLENGNGYWMKLDSAKNYMIAGMDVINRTINVNSGWNMIGAYNEVIPTTQIISNPPGIVISNYFYYINQYYVANQLEPCKGYWVKTSQAGTLTLPIPTNKKIVTENDDNEMREMTKLIFTDKNGQRASLFLANKLNAQKNYELPPVAPVPVFDARFSNGNFAESISKRNTIKLSNASYPLIMKVENLGGNVIRMRDGITGKIFDIELKDGIEISIPENIDNLTVFAENQIPKIYVLSQNYPNPFNPITRIEFVLPKNTNVKISIFDVTGKEVAVLVNDRLTAGTYQTDWDASTYASGVYFYRIQTKEYSNVKRMVLVK